MTCNWHPRLHSLGATARQKHVTGRTATTGLRLNRFRKSAIIKKPLIVEQIRAIQWSLRDVLMHCETGCFPFSPIVREDPALRVISLA